MQVDINRLNHTWQVRHDIFTLFLRCQLGLQDK